MSFYNKIPYTDIHNLNLDWIIEAMKKLEEEWTHYGATVSAKAHESLTPEVTVEGDFKTAVTFDFGIVRGAKGDTGLRGPAGAPGEKGEKGEPGKDGTGLEVKGTYPTLQALRQAHPVGAVGDMYLVGTSEFSLYVWTAEDNDYIYSGSLTSPSPSPTTPLMDGIADTGSENKYARGDHRHPTDESKLDVQNNSGEIVEVYAFTGMEQNTIKLTDDPEAGKVAMYDQVTGNLNTGEAVDETNAVNKKMLTDEIAELENKIDAKQDTLVSGVNIANIDNLSLLEYSNIGLKKLENESLTYVSGGSDTIHLKTINSESLIGTGDIVISGGGVRYIDFVNGNFRNDNISGSAGPTYSYTAERDCVLFIRARLSHVFVNGVTLVKDVPANTSDGFMNVPLKAGDIITLGSTSAAFYLSYYDYLS